MKDVFYYFQEITKIPHGSGNTEAVSRYIENFAEFNQYKHFRDEYGNVVIKADASEGYENESAIILQCHMDMVCVKEPGYRLDMEKEPVHLLYEDSWLKAKSTSLGADNGIGVAIILSVLADIHQSHPELECVFTTDEEVGMLGAAAFDYGLLHGRRMISLDSGREGIITAGSAGGARVFCSINTGKEDLKFKCCSGYKIKVSDLLGGHSGREIHKGRANAIILLIKCLQYLRQSVRFQYVEINGGSANNAIPQFAEATVVVDQRDILLFKKMVQDYEGIMRDYYSESDPLIRIEAKECRVDEKASCLADFEDVVDLIAEIPNGVQKMSLAMPDLVQTSLNLGKLKSMDNKVEFSYAVRSIEDEEKNKLVQTIQDLVIKFKGKVTIAGVYPAWRYQTESAFRDKVAYIYTDIFGKEPEVKVVHTGLECGYFFQKLNGLEIVAIGPEIRYAHTTKECVNMKSVEKIYHIVSKILAEKG